MNEIDPHKEWRLEQETDMLFFPIIEDAAKAVLAPLVKSWNENFFFKYGGELTLRTPTDGPPNARVKCPTPYEPLIEIRFSLLLEIYKDAFAFPLITGLIQKKHNISNKLHEEDYFKGARYTYDEAIPEIGEHLIKGPLATQCIAMARVVADHPTAQGFIGTNDVYCRFLLFELMLVWTFFHELSHCLQQHGVVRERMGDAAADSSQIDEMERENRADANMNGQGREILADCEGLHLTLEYLAQAGRLNHATTYLLLCAVSCTFQRFYNKWEESLEIDASDNHPHPHLRDEFAQGVVMLWIQSHLQETNRISRPEQAALPLVYLSTRASIFTGLYRANRIEKYDASRLPSYMELAYKHHDDRKREYMHVLAERINAQLPIVDELHLCPSGGINHLKAFLRNIGEEPSAS